MTIPSKEVLTDLYLTQRLSQSEIARLYGTHQNVVSEWLREAGIPTRARGAPIGIRYMGEILLPGSTPRKQPPFTKGGCPHWWVLEPPNGPTSKAECKHCHEKRGFLNSIPRQRAVSTRDIHRSHATGKFC